MNEFRYRVSPADLDDLKLRLDHTRWPDELPGVGWSYGIPVERVRALADRWPASPSRPTATSPPSTGRTCTSSTTVRPTRTRCR